MGGPVCQASRGKISYFVRPELELVARRNGTMSSASAEYNVLLQTPSSTTEGSATSSQNAQETVAKTGTTYGQFAGEECVYQTDKAQRVALDAADGI
ncbi:hypothetical protein Ciccas_013252 [Cichlidogyrus casuarinus]|uniref:Uncharacterized protein n=1 Tax=Cichlidogyrus casuarinus TaxID=1844966 RepID=A0ABD2PL75_9PLAT